jgi:hypothetical protein
VSDDLHDIRIRFESDRGCVKAPGFYRRIVAMPQIPGLPRADALDYTPDVQVYRIRPQYEGERDMSAAERDACRAWLAEQVATAVERRG